MSEAEELRRQVRELRAELDALRVTLEVVGTLDLDSGILNRTGILDALERGQKWLKRRGDIYGVVVVNFPALADDMRHGSEGIEFKTHVAATIGAAVRDVDSVGRLDDQTFAAVLADLNPGAIEVVAGRMGELIERLVASTPAMGGTYRISGLEVLSAAASGEVLDRAVQLSARADPGPLLAQLDD